MTLEEAIRRYTSDSFYEKSDGNLQGYLEFNQLAEWLKELKQLREQMQCKPPCSRCKYYDDYTDKPIYPSYCETMCTNNWNGFRER